jgi:MFS family permease
VLVVTLGRLGDMFGRVRIYNLGFVVFTLASIALSLDPLIGASGALWLILWRIVQAFGGAMLMANSAAILTDAFPARQRGMALGINQICGISGQFIGLLLGGVLAAWDWRAVFWINVPIGIFGTYWSYKKLREIASVHRAKIDWWGNLTFALGAGLLLVAITYVALLVAFCLIETKIAEPMFQLGLFKIRAFAAGNVAALMGSIARGGLQFMLIIWLQGIWLPERGYNFSQTPLLAGIYLLPLTAGFMIAGPISGFLSDRYGPRAFATGGLLVSAVAFAGLLLLPVNFSYWTFALIIFLNGVGSGLFASPNTSAIMSSVPARYRGSASGMRSTFQNSGMSLSIGIFFSLMIAGLAATLPKTFSAGLRSHGVPAHVAAHIASLPPVSTLFASFLGYNPIGSLLKPFGVIGHLSKANAGILTSKEYFPNLISGPFHHGLVIVFGVAIAMSVLGAIISLMRGGQFYYEEPGQTPVPVASAPDVGTAPDAEITPEPDPDSPADVSAGTAVTARTSH